MSNKKTISIIGLGKMGLGIYNNLNCNKHNLFGYDIDPKIIKKNTHINFLDIDKILLISDVVIIVIQTNTQIIPLLKSKKIKKNTVFLDLTTSLPENTIKIAKFLKTLNIHYFDAAMSGGAIGARDGSLTLMIGAKKKQLKENEFILSSIAKNIFYYDLDVTNENQWKELIKFIKIKFGRLDCLINNAGIRVSGKIENTSLELWNDIIKTNLTSIFLGCKYAVPLLKKGKKASIVNLTSISGIRGIKNMLAYNKLPLN